MCKLCDDDAKYGHLHVEDESSNALLEVGRQKSKLIGDNVELMQESGLTFWQALETTLKVYDIK